MGVIDVQQIVNLFTVDRHGFWVAFIFNVSGADDGEFIHPRDHKNNTLIFILQDIGLLLRMHARYDDMAALNQTDTVR